MTTSIIDNLVSDILHSAHFIQLYERISLNYGRAQIYHVPVELFRLDNRDFFDIMRYTDILSCSNDYRARNKSIRVLGLLFPYYSEDDAFLKFANAILLKLGNFPSLKLLKKSYKNSLPMPFERLLERSWKEDIQTIPHRKDTYFTDAQYHLFKRISKSRYFSFSGPTSVGKSFIIRSFVRKVLENVPPENIVIMVPTRALINQFSMDVSCDFGSVLSNRKYRIATNSNIADYLEQTNAHYILILTPERLLSYLSRPNNPPLGFLFVDEAHKLTSKGDVRSIVAYNAIERALKKHPDINLYFSSPHISNPEVFLTTFSTSSADISTQNSDMTYECPVSQNYFFVDLCQSKIWQYINNTPKLLSHDSVFNFNDCIDFVLKVGQNGNSIVYCNTRRATLSYAREAYYRLSQADISFSDAIIKAAKQIRSYVHKEFFLAQFLQAGIAYHYGNLPQIIRNIVEKLYRAGEIKYLFCTSTLLEGVNLPAKNIFILKKGHGTNQSLKPLDFKNLAGRAGRLGIELSGNVFCVRHVDNDWQKEEIIREDDDIPVQLSISSRIDHNLRRIEKIILNKNISGTEQEKKILQYIANIICLDTLDIDSDYHSPVIRQLIHDNKEKIINLAKQKIENITVPATVLESNESIDLAIQEQVYSYLKKDTHKLPHNVDYNTCLIWLKKLYSIYNWKVTEPALKNKESLAYYALLTNQWINGISLNQILGQSIDYYHDNKKEIFIDWSVRVPFDKNNALHINILANNIIDNIEHILRFLFEKYFDHYYRNLVNILGEENAGANWASYLEYGTKDTIIIILQNYGLSRHTASLIRHKHSDCLKTDEGKLKSIDRTELISRFSKDSLEYDEIATFL